MAHILITGAARRIGKAIASSLAHQGHLVLVHYNRSGSEAAQLCDHIHRQGGQAHPIAQDLLQENAAQQLFNASLEICDHLDVIINVASIFEKDNLENFSQNLWRQHQTIHVEVPLRLTQLLYHYAQKAQLQNQVAQDFSVINFTDQRVKRPNPDFFSYTASKMFLMSMTQHCAIAASPYVRVNGIAPGVTLANIRQTPQDFVQQAALTPLARQVPLEDIQNAVTFLIQSHSITGEMITLDSGQNFDWRTENYLTCKE